MGAGDYQLTGGELTVTGSVSLGSFDHTGGRLAGTHTLNNTVHEWRGGDWNTAGTTTVGATSNLVLAGSGDHDLSTRSLTNQGTVGWQQGRIRPGDGSVITNSGEWHDLGLSTLASSFGGATAFRNDFGGPVSFTNAAGGTYFKSLTGTTTFDNVPLANAGTILLEHGRIDVFSGLTLASTIELIFALGGTNPGADYGLLAVSTSVALTGTLHVEFANSFESGVTGSQSFVVASADSFSGTFLNIASGSRLNTRDGAGSFRVFYGAGSPFGSANLAFANIVPVPEPSTWLLLLVGTIPLARPLLRRRK